MTHTIIFLSKRKPQNKDLFKLPYGRFYHLAKFAADNGFDCHLVLADYAGSPAENLQTEGLNIYTGSVRNIRQYFKLVNSIAETNKPALFVGFSDIYFGLLAHHFALKYKCRYLVDAYDDYESYISWAGFLHFFWRRCLKKADGITAAGPQLLDKLTRQNTTAAKAVVPMAADPEFVPHDKNLCRKKLALPENSILIGCAGSLARNRGVEVLFEAWDILQATHPNVQLVLSGRILDNITVPEGIIHLGYMDDEQVPLLVSALDLAVVVTRNNAFGLYSYPVKLYESMACRIPVVAADTPPVAWILRDNPGFLYEAGNGRDLADKISRALSNRESFAYTPSSWNKSGKAFIECVQETLGADQPRDVL